MKNYNSPTIEPVGGSDEEIMSVSLVAVFYAVTAGIIYNVGGLWCDPYFD